ARYERTCEMCVRRVTETRAAVPSSAPMRPRRADTVLAERGLVRSRASAAQAIRAGRVRLGRDGRTLLRPSELIDPEAELELAEPERYVSRGGYKLERALELLGIDPSGRDCLDVGASTGGF